MYKRKLRDDGTGRTLGHSDEESSRKRKRGTQKHEIGSSEDETDYGKHQYSDSSRDGLPSPSDLRYGSLYLDCINNLSDADDRYVWEMFEVLPSKEEYPDYYQIIKEPIDLQTIRERFQSDAYGSLAEMEKDILLMVKNAHTYNEPRSQIYKDASTIKKAILTKKMEIERGMVATKPSDRMRSRSGPSISADSDMDSNANEDENSSSHIQEGLTPARKDDGTIRDGADDLQMAYYNAIVLYADEMGRVLSEPFLRLPSKRAYPEYYEVIKKPLAMLKIRAKIKSGGYDGLDAIEEDMNTVFNNAQTFNEDESVLHKDAIILQAFACRKKVELMRAEGILRDNNQRKQRPKTLEDTGSQSAKKKREVDPKVLRKRMKHLYDTIVSYKDETGRILSDIFMELPSPEDYPEYYKYIKNPIDLKTIDANIKSGKYPREDLLMRDFEAMFLNAKHFNEEESQVYKDAVVLEKVLKKTRKALGPVYGDNPSKQTSPIKTGKTLGSPGGGRRLSGAQLAPNQSQGLLNHIKNYRDSSGRVLCGIFEHLPSKSEYPDYYVLIKKPIDLSKIASNVETGKYSSLDDLEQDLLLMFDNACRYNEPDSQIYKDALTLQREMIQKKTELLGYQGDLVPDVPGVVQKLLKQLFDKVMGFKDDEGRCYSDSLLEVQTIPDVGEHENKRTKPISLSIIGKLLDKGFYSRLDRLQDDVFAVFQKARENSRTDSEMYEDAVELHQYFIQERDVMCKDGQKLVSQALAYGKRQFLSEVEEEKKMKHERELASDEEQKGEDRARDSKKEEILVPSDKDVIFLNEVTLDNSTYRLGDFVYVESSEGKKPHVVVIEKIWTDHQGNRGVYCCWFYRPEETFHLASRKFLEQEVFRSDHFGHISLDHIVGKCCVLHVKDYFRMKPENYKEEDVFVCESKYQVKTRSFKKIKMWSLTPPHVKLRQRDILLTPRRVSSVFAVELNKQTQKDSKQNNVELDDDEVAEYQAELEGKSVKLESPLKDDGNIYFEQFTTATGCYKIGDSVYVRSDEEYPYMSRIDKIWTDANGVPWFHGNWYLRPEEAKHMPTRMFYEQEVFQSNIEDTNPMASIMGRCCILHIKDYMICRTTELPERDVFLCESRYDEGDGHIRKLKGLKRPSLSGLIRDDELYYFDEPYLPKKKPSPLLMTKPTLADTDTESVDDNKKSIKRIREQAGFALFVSEVGVMLRKTSGDASEEEIERVAKQEWKNLSGSKKAEYEARARAQGLEPPESDESLLVYECGWRGCNHQYEDIQDLMVHVMENGGHLVKENNEYPCLWMECIRTKRGLLPFNTHSKLARHVREVHFKVAAKRIQPSEKSRNYFPRHQAAEQSSFDHPIPFTEIQHFEDRTPTRTNMPPVDTSHLLQKPFLARQVPPAMPMVSQIPIQPPMMPFRPMNVPHPQMTQSQSQPQPIPQPQPPPRMFIPRPHPVNSAPGGISAPMSSAPSEPQQGIAIQQPLTIEQQQLLLQQVQRQQQEIQKLQMQLQQTASQQPTVAPEPDSIFIPTPQSTTKLRHSEAYLRYIEGLRDNKQYMSSWNELSGAPNRPQPQAQLPFHWLDEKVFGQAPVADALWELRDHMLKDAISLSRVV